MKPKSLLLASLVVGSMLLLSATRINPLMHNPSNRLDSFPPPQNLWVDTLACIAYWDEPAVDSLPDGYYVTLGSFQPWDYTDSTYYDIPEFLEYGYTTYIDVWAKYGDSMSLPVRDTFTSGYLPIPRNLEAETWDNVVALTWEVPHRPDTTPGGSFPYWVHANFPCAGTPNEYGVETDGDFIYTTQSNGNLIFRYDKDAGVLFNSFSISGVNNLRDLAYNDDNGLFYGGNGGHTCYVMDFIAEILISTFTAPVEIQAIAWDEDQQGLWACSWSSDIMLFDLSGNLITSIPNPSMNYTGLAYDVDSDGGPYLWGFTDHYGGADLVKIDVTSGAIIGHMSVYPRVGGSGPPGGLFVARNVFVPAATTLGGILQNDRIFGLELFNWNSNWVPMVPPNLLGYNIYENDEHLVYIAYTGEDTTEYYDTVNNCMQYEHNYKVHALYDMEPYGLAGDTGESYFDETNIGLWLFHILPFKEYWVSGGFDAYRWGHDDQWTVSGQIGNPEPCAYFQGDVQLNDYTSSLTSWCIWGIGNNGGYIDGYFIFNFDIKLESGTSNGDELFLIKIITAEDTVCIDTLSNENGSFDWISLEYDITDIAFNEIFAIQFQASGLQSTDIMGWYLDNINVYWYCPEPINYHCLEITPDEYLLTWEAPDYGPSGVKNRYRDILGYKIYVDYDFLVYTEDTFYLWHPNISGNLEIGVSALYEDCESYLVDTVINVTVGLYELLQNHIKVYPNPAKEAILLDSPFNFSKIRLYDKLGRLVHEEEVSGNNVQISTSHFIAGIYMVQIMLEDGQVVSRKVVVYK